LKSGEKSVWFNWRGSIPGGGAYSVCRFAPVISAGIGGNAPVSVYANTTGAAVAAFRNRL